MKRFAGCFFALVLAAALLTGCTGGEKTFTCGELTITLPAETQDLSKLEYAADYDFLYSFSEGAVLGFKQAKAPLETKFPGITAGRYAQLFMEAIELPGTVTEQDGLVTFSYTASAKGKDVTYLCGVFMSENSFWIIQFYCAAESYRENEARFLQYLRSVKVQND